jgi:hypothetical protein
VRDLYGTIGLFIQGSAETTETFQVVIDNIWKQGKISEKHNTIFPSENINKLFLIKIIKISFVVECVRCGILILLI